MHGSMIFLLASAFFMSVFAIKTTISDAMPRIIEVIEQRSLPEARAPRLVISKKVTRHEEQLEAAVLKTDYIRNSVHETVTVRRPMIKRKMQVNSKSNDKISQGLAYKDRRLRMNKA